MGPNFGSFVGRVVMLQEEPYTICTTALEHGTCSIGEEICCTQFRNQKS